jgi:hypothetical protein
MSWVYARLVSKLLGVPVLSLGQTRKPENSLLAKVHGVMTTSDLHKKTLLTTKYKSEEYVKAC